MSEFNEAMTSAMREWGPFMADRMFRPRYPPFFRLMGESPTPEQRHSEKVFSLDRELSELRHQRRGFDKDITRRLYLNRVERWRMETGDYDTPFAPI